MSKNFSALNAPILISYFGFVFYLVASVNLFKISAEVPYFLSKISPLFLMLLFTQFYIWNKGEKSHVSINGLVFLFSLILINFYFLFDLYLSRFLVNFFNIENISWLLVLVATISGVLLILQTIFFSVSAFIKLLKSDSRWLRK